MESNQRAETVLVWILTGETKRYKMRETLLIWILCKMCSEERMGCLDHDLGETKRYMVWWSKLKMGSLPNSR
jgi:hypothetical protein